MNGMHIGQWMSSMLGRIRFTGEPRTLELRVGQVVHGVILQMLHNQDALVQIDDVQIRARLETPLQPGQATFLQVMPEGPGGQIVLKAVDQAAHPIPSMTLASLLKSLNVRDDETARQIVQYMRREGIPITAESVRDWHGAIQQLQRAGADFNLNNMLQTLRLARQFSIPMTETSLTSLHQVVFGPPLQDLTQRLLMQVERFLQEPSGRMNSSLRESLGSLLAAIRSVHQTLASNGEPPPAAAARTEAGIHQAATNFANDTQIGVRPGNGTTLHAGAMPTGGGTAAPSDGAAAAFSDGRAHMMRTGPSPTATGAAVPEQAAQPHESGRAAALSTAYTQNPPPSANASMQEMAAGQPGREAHVNPVSPEPAQADAAANRSADNRNDWIPRLLRTLGLDLERQWARLTGSGSTPTPAMETGTVGAETSRMHASGESLKAMLLQLLSSGADELPSALRETAQQTVNHITGQQLMLAGDRGASFVHMTLFIPFSQEQGDRPAAIHIQARKQSAGGSIDPHNCRLLFDLRMRHLGDTIVDVHVIDRTIHITLMNDHPMMAEWMNEAKDSVMQAIEKLGYRCAVWKCAPLSPPSEEEHKPATVPNTEINMNLDRIPKPYKGVDFRV